jgi:hypothetical protein
MSLLRMNSLAAVSVNAGHAGNRADHTVRARADSNHVRARGRNRRKAAHTQPAAARKPPEVAHSAARKPRAVERTREVAR